MTAGSWYAPYVVWASENKVAHGGGKFGPNDAVTREQMAAMLLRWATAAGIQLKESAGGTEPRIWPPYPFGQRKPSLSCGGRTASGDENGKVNPAANATRAECAAFCVRVRTTRWTLTIRRRGFPGPTSVGGRKHNLLCRYLLRPREEANFLLRACQAAPRWAIFPRPTRRERFSGAGIMMRN